MLWPLDCFAALAMTVELTQQLLGIALELCRFRRHSSRPSRRISRMSGERSE
jgi:hypothetical protein